MPGDVLVVRLNRVRLNRDWAISDDGIVGRALDPDFAVKMKDGFKTVRWRLDRAARRRHARKADGASGNFTVPLRPMLGCVAVAPGFGSAPPPTGDSGRFGGNMDFNEIVEGATVYLPVGAARRAALRRRRPRGAGRRRAERQRARDVDGRGVHRRRHARAKRLMTPRVESPTHIMAVGLGGSLEDALRAATAGLAQWLEQEYKLTPSEIAMVLGSSVEYTHQRGRRP